MSVLKGHRLDLQGLTKDYGPSRALDDVSMRVEPGEFVTILGPSGSGKTTVLMALAGFLELTTGEILLDGRPITQLPAEKRDFGVVFQGYALFPHLSVRDNVAFPLAIRGTPRAEIAARVAAALEMVKLAPLADRRPRALSGGQQQRVALARALVFAPNLFLLDEPMGALDRQLRVELQDELRALHRRLGATFVNVTHDQEEAMTLSDRIAVMRGGRIVEIGAPGALYARPRTRFVAGFLGRSNFLGGHARGHGIDLGPARVAHVPVHGPLVEGAAVTLALRPERIRLGPPPGPGFTGVAGHVVDRILTGPTVDLTVEVGLPAPLAARVASTDADLPAPGDPVGLHWAIDAAVDVED